MRAHLGHFAAALAVAVAVGPIASAQPATARPTGGLSTTSTTCAISTDRVRTYYAVACDSSWPWENFFYMAWVRCTDNVTYWGPATESFWNGTWSFASCPLRGTYTDAGYITWD